MKVKSLDREIKINDRTRKITRLVNESLFNGVDVDVNVANSKDIDMKIPMSNIENSNELTVKLMTDLTTEEVDNLSDDDFATILDACSKKK